jgi:small subunit ribosomal protein S7
LPRRSRDLGGQGNASPDLRYGEKLVSRFVNRLMIKGKKSLAFRIFYSAMDIIEKERKDASMDVFFLAMKNVTPSVQVKPRRVGGATYQVPTEVNPRRGEALACRWIISAAREKSKTPMNRSLAQEFISSAKGDSPSVKRKEDTHRMAEANRAFVHFKW